MVEKITKILLSKMLEQNVIDAEDVESYEYGIQVMILNVGNIVMAVLLGALVGKFGGMLVTLVTFVPIRQYAGGYHTKHIWTCSAMFLILMILNVMLYEVVCFTMFHIVILGVIVILFIAVFAPVGPGTKHLTKQQKKKNKRKSVFICVLYVMNMAKKTAIKANGNSSLLCYYQPKAPKTMFPSEKRK